MKIIACGDVHGRSIWKDIVNKEADADLFIFSGDYFDTHDRGHSPNRQIENFKDILSFKKANMDRVILLIGNHDFHYIKGVGETYSGYQATYAIDIGAIIQTALNEDLLQMCYIHNMYLFSHAGVTQTWCADNEINMSNLAESINDLFKYKPNSFKFTVGERLSQTGDDITQGPIWVRPASLLKDKLNDYIFVVGHTSVNYLDISRVDEFKILIIDSLGTSREYLIITDDILSVGKI